MVKRIIKLDRIIDPLTKDYVVPLYLDKEYRSLAEKMGKLTISKYGCIDFISIHEGDQEVAISYWKSEDQIKEWKADPQHLHAQELGKKKWYKDFQVQ